MRNLAFIISGSALVVAIVLAFLLKGKLEHTDKITRDVSMNMNGGFEQIADGKPVKWSFTYPHRKDSQTLQIISDTLEFREGNQSLNLILRRCGDGIKGSEMEMTQNIMAFAGKKYQVNFWIKNQSTDFMVQIGGASGEYSSRDTIIRSAGTINSWKYINHIYSLPIEYDTINFSIRIFKPGSFWIDGIKILSID